MTVSTDNLTSDVSVPLVPVPKNPAPTRDREYLERMEATLTAAEESVAQESALDAPPEQRQERKTKLAVSVVIPVFNECDTVEEIIHRVQSVGIHSEIIVVDDYSLDGTREVLLRLAQQSDVRVLLHGYNRGKGAALRTAFAVAQGEVILIQDADLEYNPEDYHLLLKPLELGLADAVYGSRFLSNATQDPSRVHRLGNWLLTHLSNRLSGLKLTDMETCYKVFRRDLLEKFSLEQNRFGFEPEFTAKLAKAGARIVEVPVSYASRSYDEGKKIGLRDGLNALWCIARYGW